MSECLRRIVHFKYVFIINEYDSWPQTVSSMAIVRATFS